MSSVYISVSNGIITDSNYTVLIGKKDNPCYRKVQNGVELNLAIVYGTTSCVAKGKYVAYCATLYGIMFVTVGSDIILDRHQIRSIKEFVHLPVMDKSTLGDVYSHHRTDAIMEHYNKYKIFMNKGKVFMRDSKVYRVLEDGFIMDNRPLCYADTIISPSKIVEDMWWYKESIEPVVFTNEKEAAKYVCSYVIPIGSTVYWSWIHHRPSLTDKSEFRPLVIFPVTKEIKAEVADGFVPIESNKGDHYPRFCTQRQALFSKGAPLLNRKVWFKVYYNLSVNKCLNLYVRSDTRKDIAYCYDYSVRISYENGYCPSLYIHRYKWDNPTDCKIIV